MNITERQTIEGNVGSKQTVGGNASTKKTVNGKIVAIPSLDKTLTKEGFAADAHAVGEALNQKAEQIHKHTKSEITDFPTSMPASDVYEWAKQPQKPSYTASEVGAKPSSWMPTAAQVGARPSDWMPSAEDVGARPNTWMPSADDVGARSNTWLPTADEVGARSNTWIPTAEEVGARPKTWMPSAEEVGARPNTWLPTLAELGGQKLIGIGQYTGDLNDYGKLMNTVAWVNGSGVTNSPSTNFAIVETWSHGGAIILQRFTSTSGSVVTRLHYNSAWTEWEWENPPFTAGKEYRTTKRVTGTAVYTMRINFGALPNATSKRVKMTGYTDAYTMRKIEFIMKNNTAGTAMQLAYAADPGFFIEETSDNVFNVVVNTTGNFSAYNGYVTIEYTK